MDFSKNIEHDLREEKGAFCVKSGNIKGRRTYNSEATSATFDNADPFIHPTSVQNSSRRSLGSWQTLRWSVGPRGSEHKVRLFERSERTS